tara:strand:+ start:164 stop:643 length:480 start_codon:yes stop_codon:yes gene_type:complete
MKQLIQSASNYFFGMQYHVIGLYRLSRYFRLRVPVVGGLLSVIVRHVLRVYSSCDISPLAVIEKGVSFMHPTGVVIGDGVIVRSGTKIWQQVTLGSHGRKGEEMCYPTIGNNVIIYAKSSIIGGVEIGGNAIIGAHSLVLCDVPQGRTAAGVPATVLDK